MSLMRVTIFSQFGSMRVGMMLALVCFAPAVLAGDEVDYSAPYLVVEDGKLVTKYPGQQHQAQPVEGADTTATETPQTDADVRGPAAQPWLFTGAVLAVLLAGLAVTMRRPA